MWKPESSAGSPPGPPDQGPPRGFAPTRSAHGSVLWSVTAPARLCSTRPGFPGFHCPRPDEASSRCAVWYSHADVPKDFQPGAVQDLQLSCPRKPPGACELPLHWDRRNPRCPGPSPGAPAPTPAAYADFRCAVTDTGILPNPPFLGRTLGLAVFASRLQSRPPIGSIGGLVKSPGGFPAPSRGPRVETVPPDPRDFAQGFAPTPAAYAGAVITAILPRPRPGLRPQRLLPTQAP